MNKNSRIYVAGHRGLVGSAVVRTLKQRGYANLLIRSHKDLDLTDQAATRAFFEGERPEFVILAAAKVGGILANSTYKADFIYDNLVIATNVIHAAWRSGVEKLINLGSSCIYPKLAPQPLKEEYLLTAPLEPTNEPYAIAKIAAIKLCCYFNEQCGTNFVSLMPTNLYGPEDNFDLETSHVLPALIRKFHGAAEASQRGDAGAAVELWGDGSPRREFLYVDDLADAIVFVLEKLNASDLGELANVGTGTDISIQDLAGMIAEVVGYTGPIRWDTSRPNGTPQKLLDVSRLKALGWSATTDLTTGVKLTHRWYIENQSRVRGVA
jgi:GDP-L-fucose synthase